MDRSLISSRLVEIPAYRNNKLNTMLGTLPDLLQGQGGTRLQSQADGMLIKTPRAALLLFNSPYWAGDIAGLGRRAAAYRSGRRREHTSPSSSS